MKKRKCLIVHGGAGSKRQKTMRSGKKTYKFHSLGIHPGTKQKVAYYC